MSKKRGVVVSMTDHVRTNSKTKSAQADLLNAHLFNYQLTKLGPKDEEKQGELEAMEKVSLVESNVLNSQPECMVNKAYYTYEDPDLDVDHDNNKQEQNEQYFIESMHKKKQMQQNKRKNQEKPKPLQKNGKDVVMNSREKKQLKNRQAEKNRFDRLNKYASSPRTKMAHQRDNNKYGKPFSKKFESQNENGQIPKKQLNSERFKPKPLDFDIDILQKLPMKPANKRKTEIVPNLRTLFPTVNEQYVPVFGDLQNEQQAKGGENRNSRKLPFRFQGVV